MKKLLPLLVTFALSAVMAAQTNIPVGTVIPVELDRTIDANHAKTGQTITAKVAQDVMFNGLTIKAGTRVQGEILAATPASGSQPAAVTLRFNQIDVSGKSMPVLTNLRALASPLEIEAAQTQVSGDDRGSTPAWNQTTTLVGGNDVAYREVGTLKSGTETVGKSVYAGNWGAVAPVAANPEGRCRGEIANNNQPQSLWVFSHDACGAYGFDAVISHAGRSNPQGQIVLTSTKGNLKVRGGSAMLLRVDGNDSQVSQN
jgi:hypothetical protein